MEIIPLKKCPTRSLIKCKAKVDAVWAITGQKAPGYFPVVFLTGDNAPFILNVLPDPGDFERYPVLSFGDAWRVVPKVLGHCEIGDGPLSKTAGSLVLHGEDQFLLVNRFNQPGQRWFDLNTGKDHAEPGIERVGFAGWDLLMEGVGAKPSETAVVSWGR